MKKLLILTIIMFNTTSQAAQFPEKPQDWTIVCRYNQGPKKVVKMKCCMEYSRKVMRAYDSMKATQVLYRGTTSQDLKAILDGEESPAQKNVKIELRKHE